MSEINFSLEIRKNLLSQVFINQFSRVKIEHTLLSSSYKRKNKYWPRYTSTRTVNVAYTISPSSSLRSQLGLMMT